MTCPHGRGPPRYARAAALACLVLAAAGCAPFRPGMPGTATPATTAARQGVGTLIAGQALAQAGAPYRYGGAEPGRGFDCSGLVTYAHAREGIDVPRTAAAQFAAARKVQVDALQPGDLVFFRLVPGSREVTHVGIYTGEGRFVHAPQTGRRVGEARLDDPYYSERFAGAGRLHSADAGAGKGLSD